MATTAYVAVKQGGEEVVWDSIDTEGSSWSDLSSWESIQMNGKTLSAKSHVCL